MPGAAVQNDDVLAHLSVLRALDFIGQGRRLGGDLDTVKRSITLAAERCHVEVTTLLVPGENDSVAEIHALAQWLASVNPDIPLHLSRFFPQYEMQDRPPTPVEDVYRLADEARIWLTYVYTGNC